MQGTGAVFCVEETMKKRNVFADLNRFERILWSVSLLAIVISFVVSGGKDPFSAVASMIGVTSLIFIAKGYVFGQWLTVVFSVLYGIISLWFRYFGEMITYLGMSAPMAIMAAISWMRHPYEGTREVEVSRLTKGKLAILLGSSVVVTYVFYLILKALGNASLAVSTVSITTSYLAAGLIFLRSPWYALAYAANDIVLVILWIVAAREDISCLPMVMCFVMFLANDLYAFYNWGRMQRRQDRHSAA